MKKIVFYLLFFLIKPVCAEVVNYECGENCTATLNTESGVMRVSGTGDMYGYDTETRYHTPWLDAGYANQIKTVVVEEGITNVGMFAFFKCSNIETIELAQSVKTVAWDAFDEDRYVKNIKMFDETVWNPQDDMNANNDSPSIRIDCYGNIEKCRKNFVEKMGTKFKGNPSFRMKGKRIYTIEEATKLSKPTGNTIKLRYK